MRGLIYYIICIYNIHSRIYTIIVFYSTIQIKNKNKNMVSYEYDMHCLE